MIIAIDFDGTCTTHEYPGIGRDIGAEPVLKKLVAAGHRLILWTMRSSSELEDAIRWFRQRDIPLYGVNRNPTQICWTKSPKPYAHLYIDDAALGCPLCKPELPGESCYVDWEKVEHLLFPAAGAGKEAGEVPVSASAWQLPIPAPRLWVKIQTCLGIA